MVNSSRVIENILNSVITGIISFFFPLFMSLIYSIIIGWNYKISVITVISTIPIYVFAILFIPFCYWWIRKYIKGKMNEGVLLSGFSTYKNYEGVDRIEYNNLLWTILVEQRTLRHVKFYGNIDDINTFQELTNNLLVGPTPRCSRCGAELYFTQQF